MKIIATYTAGADNKKFRHVVGATRTEVENTDELGDVSWTSCNAPLGKEVLLEKVVNALAASYQLDPHEAPGYALRKPANVRLASGRAGSLLIVDLGKQA